MTDTTSQSPQEQTDSVESLIRLVLESDKPVKEQKDIIDELRKLRAPLEDRWIYRYVVLFLGFSGLLTVVFVFWLSKGATTGTEVNIPDGLIALGSAAIGALAGMLVPSTGQNKGEQ